MIDILRRHAAEFVRGEPTAAVPQVQSTLAKIGVCRTSALGSKLYGCRECGEVKRVHHSCGDRHCPQCRGAVRATWVDAAERWILPDIDYYQVVFTIPAELSSLTLGNRRSMFNLLFRSAWQSLRKTVEDEQQFEAAAAMVLHTWNQKLDAHTHVHAVVPGGGPSLDRPGRWKSAEPPPDRDDHDNWLVDAVKLRVEFRTRFLRGLQRLHRNGKLKLNGEWSDLRDADRFAAWLEPLQEVTWVTYIQPPPTRSSGPTDIVKYLARYLTGGPISDFRLTDYDGQRVTFTARTGAVHGGSDDVEDVTLPMHEFVRRWCLHILPRGFTKTRRFGGLTNHHSARYLNECRTLLNPQSAIDNHEETTATTTENPEPVTSSFTAEHACPSCGHPMEIVHRSHRISWREIFSGPDRPRWYHPPIRAA